MGYVTTDYLRFSKPPGDVLNLKFAGMPNGLAGLSKRLAAGGFQWVVLCGAWSAATSGMMLAGTRATGETLASWASRAWRNFGVLGAWLQFWPSNLRQRPRAAGRGTQGAERREDKGPRVPRQDLRLQAAAPEGKGVRGGRPGPAHRSDLDHQSRQPLSTIEGWGKLMFFCEVGGGRNRGYEKLAVFGSVRGRPSARSSRSPPCASGSSTPRWPTAA